MLHELYALDLRENNRSDGSIGLDGVATGFSWNMVHAGGSIEGYFINIFVLWLYRNIISNN